METKEIPLPLNLSGDRSARKGEKHQESYAEDRSSSAGPYVRYSDSDLAEFKELILSKLEESRNDYQLLKGTLSRHNDPGTADTSPTFKLWEDAEEVLTKEEVSLLAYRLEKYIYHLQNALIRIENKTYGICKVTGRLIPKERLKSVPHATMTIDARLVLEEA